jgi:hypothetical protein
MNVKPESSKKINLLISNDFPPVVSGISTVFYQRQLTDDIPAYEEGHRRSTDACSKQ